MTKKTPVTALPLDPLVDLPPEMRGLYDLLMMDIEPDLLIEVLPTLDAKYEGESDEQKTLRLERYEKAFDLFQVRFQESISTWRKEVSDFKRQAIHASEATNKTNETKNIQSIEDSINA